MAANQVAHPLKVAAIVVVMGMALFHDAADLAHVAIAVAKAAVGLG
jgi:hypothetical protein